MLVNFAAADVSGLLSAVDSGDPGLIGDYSADVLMRYLVADDGLYAVFDRDMRLLLNGGVAGDATTVFGLSSADGLGLEGLTMQDFFIRLGLQELRELAREVGFASTTIAAEQRLFGDQSGITVGSYFPRVDPADINGQEDRSSYGGVQTLEIAQALIAAHLSTVFGDTAVRDEIADDITARLPETVHGILAHADGTNGVLLDKLVFRDGLVPRSNSDSNAQPDGDPSFVLLGGVGEDTFQGISGGIDVLFGGAGNDLVDYETGQSDGGAITVLPTADPSVWFLNQDTTDGSGGEDTLIDIERIVLSIEADTFLADGAFDEIFPDLDPDRAPVTISGGTAPNPDEGDVIDFSQSSSGVVVGLDSPILFTDFERFIGTESDDGFGQLQPGHVWLEGHGGNDILYGSTGADVLYGGEGSDTLEGGAGNDLLVHEEGVDRLRGGAGNDLFDLSMSADGGAIIYLDGDFGHDGIKHVPDADSADAVFGGDQFFGGGPSIFLAGVRFGRSATEFSNAFSSSWDGTKAGWVHFAQLTEPAIDVTYKITGHFNLQQDALLAGRYGNLEQFWMWNGDVEFTDPTTGSSIVVPDVGATAYRQTYYQQFGDTRQIDSVHESYNSYSMFDIGFGEEDNAYVYGRNNWLGHFLTVDELRASSDLTGMSRAAQVLEEHKAQRYSGNDEFNGTSNDDTFDSKDGNDTLYGNDGNDMLISGNGGNIVYGGAGDDEVISTLTPQSDSYFGGAGNDTLNLAGSSQGVTFSTSTGDIVFSSGTAYRADDFEHVVGTEFNDNVSGDVTDNLIVLNSGDDTANASDGADFVSGGAGDDVLYAGAGNDTIDAGTGSDTLFGGAGLDLFRFQAGDGVDQIVDFNATDDRIQFLSPTSFAGLQISNDGLDTLITYGSAQDEIRLIAVQPSAVSEANFVFSNVIGTDQSDTLLGSPYVDTFDALSGDDVVVAGLGADSINGGPGDDFVDYSPATTSVEINLSSGTLLGDFAVGDVLVSIEGVIGSDFNDTLTSGSGWDTLIGGEGDDTLIGLEGSDTLIGEDGADMLYGGNFNDFLYGGAGNDYIFGGYYNDQVDGGEGDDILFGGGGADVLEGGPGADTFYGGSGQDWATYYRSFEAVSVSLQTGSVSGGDAAGDVLTGIDNISGSRFDDYLEGSNGSSAASASNTLWGNEGDDTIAGLGAQDWLFGGENDDVIRGGSGDDHMYGGAGNDHLQGDGGHDTLEGGAGGDTIDGGGVTDFISYKGSNAAVDVDLSTGQASGGHATGDVILSGGHLIGSGFNDTLVGESENNNLLGEGGDDILRGGVGRDFIIGGSGFDIVDYSQSPSSVSVSLSSFSNFPSGGHAETDVLRTVEGVIGSEFDDSLWANPSQYTSLYGLGGNDTLNGSRLNDGLYGGDGDDVISGNDLADGRPEKPLALSA